MTYQAPRGTQDLLPEDWPYWEHVISRAKSVAARYGYGHIDTPMFEETSLFVRGVGEGTDIVDKEMYSFQDKGGDQLTLRPEFTAGIMRAYLEHNMHLRPQPMKLFAIGPIFRYERPQAGRYRIHNQFNVEAVGERDPAVDVEVMSVAWDLYEDLGFTGLSFQVNNIGDGATRRRYVQDLVSHYQPHAAELPEDDKRRLARNPLRLLDSKETASQHLIESAPKIADYLSDDSRQHFDLLRRYLDALGRPYTVNHRLVRGFDYYTDTVFEVYAEGIGAQAAVCGGGRYDGLVELLGGPRTPGIGFGSGIERIILAMKEQGIPAPGAASPQVSVIPLGQDSKAAAVQLVQQLRTAGLRTVLSFGQRSLKAHLRGADRLGVTYALLLGDQELANGQVTARRLTGEGAGNQETLSLQETAEWLKERMRDEG